MMWCFKVLFTLCFSDYFLSSFQVKLTFKLVDFLWREHCWKHVGSSQFTTQQHSEQRFHRVQTFYCRDVTYCILKLFLSCNSSQDWGVPAIITWSLATAVTGLCYKNNNRKCFWPKDQQKSWCFSVAFCVLFWKASRCHIVVSVRDFLSARC